MSRAEILAEVARHPARFVCLTGGEPTLQKQLPQLAQELLDRGYQVSLETHGQRPLWDIPRGVRKIVDLKTPGSEEAHTDFAVFRHLSPGDEVKVVVCSRDDFQWALHKLDELDLWGKVPILFSPSYGQVAAPDLAAWVLESGKPARLQLQLHKLIWGEKRGV
jgi:7-carboxy-7-deazaguanine synthase